MLTLPEAIAAIKALDTPGDIISQACAKVLKPDVEEQPTEAKEIAQAIVREYIDKVELRELMIAGALVSARIAGTLARRGLEAEVLEYVTDLFASEFAISRIEFLVSRAKRK